MTTRAVTFPPGIIYLIQQQSQDPMQELIRHESIRREIQNVNRVHLTPQQRQRLAALEQVLQQRDEYLRQHMRQKKVLHGTK